MDQDAKPPRKANPTRTTLMVIGVAASIGVRVAISSHVVLACSTENRDETSWCGAAVMEAGPERAEPDDAQDSGFDVGVGTSGLGWGANDSGGIGPATVWLSAGSKALRWQAEYWHGEGRSEYDGSAYVGGTMVREYRYDYERRRGVQFLLARGFRVDQELSPHVVVGAGYEGNRRGYTCATSGYLQRQVACGPWEPKGQHGFGIFGVGVDASIGSRFYLRAQVRYMLLRQIDDGPILLPVLGMGVRF